MTVSDISVTWEVTSVYRVDDGERVHWERWVNSVRVGCVQSAVAELDLEHGCIIRLRHRAVAYWANGKPVRDDYPADVWIGLVGFARDDAHVAVCVRGAVEVRCRDLARYVSPALRTPPEDGSAVLNIMVVASLQNRPCSVAYDSIRLWHCEHSYKACPGLA